MNKKEQLTKKMELLKMMLEKNNDKQLEEEKKANKELFDNRLENKEITNLRK